MQRNLTGSKTLTSSSKFVFFGQIGKTRWPPWPLIHSARLAETFSTSPLKPLNGIQQNLTGSKTSSTSSTKFVFLAPIEKKPRLPPWSLICWDIFDFSETAERNPTKLDRKQDLNVLYQVCVFPADRKNKIAARDSHCLRHFRLLLWNRWTEFNETWQEARHQRPLPSLCFSGQSEKQDGRHGLWFTQPDWLRYFRLLLWNRWTEFNETWHEARPQRPLSRLCFWGRSEKARWPPWPLIGWDIIDFSSETAERNSTKLDRKQDLNVLYQVCVFPADRKNKIAARYSDCLRHFRLLLWNRWTEFNDTWQEARHQRPLPSLCFSGKSEKQDGHHGLWFTQPDWLRYFRLLLWNRWTEFNETWHEARPQRPLPRLCFWGRSEKARWPPWPLIGWDIFDLSSETTERNSTKLDRKQDLLNVLYQVCVVGADRKKQDCRPGLWFTQQDWLRHFWLLLWNRWTEFNKTWQEARPPQRPLPSLCFWRRSKKKQDCRPGLWFAETFSTSPLKPLNGIQRNLAGSKISTSSTKFVFFRPIGKTNWPPWPLIGWDIFNFSSKTAERNSTKLDRKQDVNVLYQVCVFPADRKNKIAARDSDCLRHFRLLLWNRWTECNETWPEARPKRPLPSLCFSGKSEKQDGRHGLWFTQQDWLRHFRLLLWNRWTEFNKTWSKTSTSSTMFVFLGPIGKTRWPPWTLDWLRYHRLLFWNRWTEFNETWQEARPQRPLPSLCFSGRSEKQNSRPGFWLPETFSTSPLKPLNRIQRNLTGSKTSTSSSKFVFFSGQSEKQDGRPGLWLAETFSTSLLKPLNGIQRNLTGSKTSTSSTKFVLWGRSEKQDGHPGLWLAETFSTSLLKPLNGIQRNLTGIKTSTSSTKFVFFGTIGKTKWPPLPLIDGDIFNFSSKTAERNSTKLDWKQDVNVLYQVCVFQDDRKNKMAALASDWLRHFQLLLWNRWTEFNEM